METALEEALAKRLGRRDQSKWLHVPAEIVVGMPSHEDTAGAAVSARWMKDSWTSEYAFKSWTGYAPSTSRSGQTEIMKAASGKVFSVANEPVSGFKLVNWQDDEEESDWWKDDSGCGVLDGKDRYCVTKVKRSEEAYCDPVLVVEDPRGWRVMVAAQQVLRLLAASKQRLDGLELPGPLVYVFSRQGFTLDFPDGQTASKAILDKDLQEIVDSIKAKRAAAEPKLGEVYVADSKRLMYIGKLPDYKAIDKLTHSILCCNFMTFLKNEVSDILSPYQGWSSSCSQADRLSRQKDRIAHAASRALSYVNAKYGSKMLDMMPWNDSNYIDACKKLRSALSDASSFTFVDLGEVPEQPREVKQVSAQEACASSMFYNLWTEDKKVSLSSDTAYYFPWHYSPRRLKQVKQAEAKSISLLKTSRNKTLHVKVPDKSVLADLDICADVTAADLLAAESKRTRWLLKCLDIIEECFPCKQLAGTAAEYAKGLDALLAQHPEYWSLVAHGCNQTIEKVLAS